MRANPRSESVTSADTADGMGVLRAAVARQLRTEHPAPPDVDPGSLIRFSPLLPTTLDLTVSTDLRHRASELDPWLQGPFLLGGDVVVGGAWRTDNRWKHELGDVVPGDLQGRRVLDVGSNAGYDPFMFKLRGAGDVVGCEPFVFHRQALFLESIYRSGVDFQNTGWQQLEAGRLGRFDLVHCHGVLYHEAHPMALLQQLRALVSESGELLLGSMMLADPQQADAIRFVPGAYSGDPTWWMVPGLLALRRMLEAAGFSVTQEFGLGSGLRGEFPVMTGYLRCKPCDPDPLRGTLEA